MSLPKALSDDALLAIQSRHTNGSTPAPYTCRSDIAKLLGELSRYRACLTEEHAPAKDDEYR